MDKFEAQAENMDVHSSVMEQGMGASSTLSTPADQVFSADFTFFTKSSQQFSLIIL